MMTCSGRCVALTGEVGRKVACSIYPIRPGICRDVAPGSVICMLSLGLRGIPVSFEPGPRTEGGKRLLPL